MSSSFKNKRRCLNQTSPQERFSSKVREVASGIRFCVAYCVVATLLVHSVALNPVGYKLMQLVPWPMARYPMIPEGDFSGTIVAGENTGGWNVKKGDGESPSLIWPESFRHGSLADPFIV